MKKSRQFLPLLLLLPLLAATSAPDTQPADDPYAPHTPTLIFYLTGATTPEDSDAIRAAIAKQKSASVAEINTTRSYARIRFDSHVVSYHQIAQALSDAGSPLHKTYDPTLLLSIPAYNTKSKQVDTLFAGKRLNSRVHITPLDKSQGLFQIHFLPLTLDPASTAPQGFNGGHLHHPLSDPAPRGLALPSSYASTDTPTTQPTTAPATTQ